MKQARLEAVRFAEGSKRGASRNRTRIAGGAVVRSAGLDPSAVVTPPQMRCSRHIAIVAAAIAGAAVLSTAACVPRRDREPGPDALSGAPAAATAAQLASGAAAGAAPGATTAASTEPEAPGPNDICPVTVPGPGFKERPPEDSATTTGDRDAQTTGSSSSPTTSGSCTTAATATRTSARTITGVRRVGPSARPKRCKRWHAARRARRRRLRLQEVGTPSWPALRHGPIGITVDLGRNLGARRIRKGGCRRPGSGRWCSSTRRGMGQRGVSASARRRPRARRRAPQVERRGLRASATAGTPPNAWPWPGDCERQQALTGLPASATSTSTRTRRGRLRPHRRHPARGGRRISCRGSRKRSPSPPRDGSTPSSTGHFCGPAGDSRSTGCGSSACPWKAGAPIIGRSSSR